VAIRPRGSHPAFLATAKGNENMETSHVSALQEKHEGLDRRLREELNRPAPDAAKVQIIKKQKLRLKEEISHA